MEENRVDIAAGHEDTDGFGFGLIEVVPSDSNSQYYAQLFRYGSDSTTIIGERLNSFSIADNFSSASRTTQYVGISRGGQATNYLELYNTSSNIEPVTVTMYGNQSGLISTGSYTLSPKQSLHLATTSLGENESGIASITSGSTAVIAKSVAYFYRPDGHVASAYATNARELLGSSGRSEFNTFLSQLNWLRLFNVSSNVVTVTITGYNQDGSLRGSFNIQLLATSGIDINLNSALSLDSDRIGTIALSTSEANAVLGNVLRIRANSDATHFVEAEILAVN